MSAGASTQSLQCSPDLIAGFKGSALCITRVQTASWQEGNGGEGRTKERGTGKGRGKGGMGKRGEKGKLGGIAPWLLRDRRPYTGVASG